MTIDEAISVLIQVERYPTNIKGKDTACEMAIEALHEKLEAEKNEPLMPEELLKMDGQPVFIRHSRIEKYDKVWMIWDVETMNNTPDGLSGYNVFWWAYSNPKNGD